MDNSLVIFTMCKIVTDACDGHVEINMDNIQCIDYIKDTDSYEITFNNGKKKDLASVILDKAHPKNAIKIMAVILEKKDEDPELAKKIEIQLNSLW